MSTCDANSATSRSAYQTIGFQGPQRRGALDKIVARGSERRDPLSDERARAAYQERISELRDDLAEAERRHDLGASQVLRQEMGWIERELSHSDWLAPDRSSRARKAVYNRVQGAIRRIDAQLPALGRHLRNSIRTGTTCIYCPEGHVMWTIRAPTSGR